LDNIFEKRTPCYGSVIFARISSPEQEKGVSLEAQANLLDEYCNRNYLNIIRRFSFTESSTQG
jgi:hypothetical protein